MQLAGPHVFGPPAHHDGALEVLREVVSLGITHIDTSDFYGPHITKRLIREALHPYPEQLRIVTKVGALRDAEGNWPRALAPDELRQAVHDNLTNLGVGALDVVNLWAGGQKCSPTSSSLLAQSALACSGSRAYGLTPGLTGLISPSVTCDTWQSSQ
jgi:pyridoxine 4-dehydrogenase